MLETDWSLEMLSESIEEDCWDIHGHDNLQVHCHSGQEGHGAVGIRIALAGFMPHPLP